jgi:UMF1 family MFS transporter
MNDAPPKLPPAMSRREVLAWATYDWASSAYSTLAITVLVTYVSFCLDKVGEDLGALVWAWGIGGTMFVAAVLSPIFGAIADAHASKRRWLGGTALLGSAASCLMFFATPDRPWLLVGLFLFANLCYELSLGFYNGFLPEIAHEENMGRVSAWGYAFGYLGGGVALALMLALFKFSPALGLPRLGDDPASLLPRLSLLFMGLWWGAFTLTAIYGLKDRGRRASEKKPLLKAVRQAMGEVAGTLRNIRRYRTLAIFLVGFLIYNDGIQTVISQASVYAGKVLRMPTAELLQVILMIQFVAMPGAWLVGRLADKLGQKRTLAICLVVWVAVLAAALFVETTGQFWIMAAVVALVLGGVQSVSRTIMGLMTPASRTAEFFGFFNLSGKATSIFGPFFFGAIVYATGSAQLALASLLVFFVVGGLIISAVNVEQGRREAREEGGSVTP